jgi:hypothetical protein
MNEWVESVSLTLLMKSIPVAEAGSCVNKKCCLPGLQAAIKRKRKKDKICLLFIDVHDV